MKGARERASETTRGGCPSSTSRLYGLLSLRNQGYGGAERCADGGDARLLEDEARGQGIEARCELVEAMLTQVFEGQGNSCQ